MKTFNIAPQINEKFPFQIYGPMLGMWDVTEENYGEFYVRLQLLDQLNGGPLLKAGEEPYEITPERAKEHIGCRLRDQDLDREAWWLRVLSGRVRSLENTLETATGYEFPRSDEDD